LFWPLAVLAAASGVMVFRFNSMARAAISLLVSFLAAGGLVILLGLGYLGVVVILMMVIEMIIMAVFMIAYMMNPAGLMQMSMVHNKRGALAISAVVFVFLGSGALLVPWPHRAGGRPRDPTFQVGSALMGPQMLTMIILGFVLLAAMVGAVVLATHRGRYDRFGDDLKRRPPADPVRGGVGR
jgi:NADH:ubiquinone oxidoreductase subunit 6 (subunit J)